MKLGILVIALAAAGISLIAFAGAQVLGDWIFPAVGGLSCLLALVGLVGGRKIMAILSEGAIFFSDADEEVDVQDGRPPHPVRRRLTLRERITGRSRR